MSEAREKALETFRQVIADNIDLPAVQAVAEVHFAVARGIFEAGWDAAKADLPVPVPESAHPKGTA